MVDYGMWRVHGLYRRGRQRVVNIGRTRKLVTHLSVHGWVGDMDTSAVKAKLSWQSTVFLLVVNSWSSIPQSWFCTMTRTTPATVERNWFSQQTLLDYFLGVCDIIDWFTCGICCASSTYRHPLIPKQNSTSFLLLLFCNFVFVLYWF